MLKILFSNRLSYYDLTYFFTLFVLVKLLCVVCYDAKSTLDFVRNTLYSQIMFKKSAQPLKSNEKYHIFLIILLQ